MTWQFHLLWSYLIWLLCVCVCVRACASARVRAVTLTRRHKGSRRDCCCCCCCCCCCRCYSGCDRLADFTSVEAKIKFDTVATNRQIFSSVMLFFGHPPPGVCLPLSHVFSETKAQMWVRAGLIELEKCSKFCPEKKICANAQLWQPCSHAHNTCTPLSVQMSNIKRPIQKASLLIY